jgi:hypothetical protein
LEARLPPDVLANLLESEIRGCLDMEILEADQANDVLARRTITRELPAPERAS